MYYIFKVLEKLIEKIKCKIKIFYYKLKYGRRIKIGKKVNFRNGMIINISNKGYLEIGDYCFFNNYCSINCHEKIIIGKNNLFGENVKIYDHNHVFNDKSIDKRYSFKSNSIIIGNNCWVCSNVVLLSKSNIEDNVVIGAGIVLNDKVLSNNMVIIGEEYYKINKINYK